MLNLGGCTNLDIVLAIRHRRKVRGLTRSALAIAAGLTDAEVSRYERGAVPIPSAALVKIADALGCDVQTLAGATPS